MINRARNNPVSKDDTGHFSELKTIFGKSLAVNKPVFAGEIVKMEDLESKKPGNKGLPAKDYQSLTGKRWKKSLIAWDFIDADDIE
jgi:N-acetylneuraminate synthase